MMSRFQTMLMNHLKPVARWVSARRASSFVRVPSLALRVELENRCFEFQPQFKCRRSDGGEELTVDFSPDAAEFVGWLPYFNKRWPSATNKLAFKDFARDAGIRVPQFSKMSALEREFVVKADVSSFGQGIRGPFPAGTGVDALALLGDKEYLDEFVEGQILKALYWNRHLCCVFLSDMPQITGNGKDSVAGLLDRVSDARDWRTSREGTFNIALRMLARSGIGLDHILPDGTRQTVDFRFGSPFDKWTRNNTNCIESIDTALRAQLDDIGSRLLRAIPEEIRENTAFSVDGIVSGDGMLWCLEMNCNPMLHPDIYPMMLDSIFADSAAIPRAYTPLRQRAMMQGGTEHRTMPVPVVS